MEEARSEIWKKYEACRRLHLQAGMQELAEKCRRFYRGDQWHGLKTGGEPMPKKNFIKPTCKYKINLTAMNEMAIVFSGMDEDEETRQLCDYVNRFVERQAERLKLSRLQWSVVKGACLTGDHYLYFFRDGAPSGSVAGGELALKARGVKKESLYLADESEPDLQEQEWIIIEERLPVGKVRKAAQKAGLAKEDLQLIQPDGAELETADSISDEDKVTSLLYLEKTDRGLSFCRSCRDVIYEPMQELPGLRVYPVAGMRWEEVTDSARGRGNVEDLLDNQMEVNKTLARRAICVKRFAYPHRVVNRNYIRNTKLLDRVGSTIQLDADGEVDITKAIGYLTPPPMGPDAAALENELQTSSRELEGAGDAATGQVDPTQASGESIKAARDQSAMNLNEQITNYKDFVESVGRILLALMIVYSPDPLILPGDEESPDLLMAKADLQSRRLNVKIDVSPVDPYSVLARQMALENALNGNHITFEEYVANLDENGGAPKAKLQKILEKRKQDRPLPDVQPDGILPGMEGLPNEMQGL